MADVRRSAVAGQWYPGRRDELQREVDVHLAAVVVDESVRCPQALIAPHAGLVYSGPVAAWAYACVRNCAYAAVVMVGPSHFIGFEGVSVWPRGVWESPLGPITVADQLAATIAAETDAVVEHAQPHLREHSLEMQLPFVARLLPGVPIVPLLMGYQSRATAMGLGDALARAISRHQRSDGAVLLVASSDLSHYEDAVTASRLDGVVLRHVEALDADALMSALEREPRHACGGGPMVSVLQAASRLGGRQARVLRYADSGDVSGDKSSVVGYMAAAIW
jgi:AmmeMemoRadiSam system protein B